MTYRRAGQSKMLIPGAKRLAAGFSLLAILVTAATASAWWAPPSDTAPLPTKTISPTATPANVSQPAPIHPASNFAPYSTPSATPVDGEQPAEVILDDAGRRWSEQTMTLDAYYWMLLTWKDNSVKCKIYVAHDGQPSEDEIIFSCGETVYDQWLDTPECTKSDVTKCTGLYLHYAGRQTERVTQMLELPKPSVEIITDECQPYLPCDRRPTLLFKASEPLPEYQIQEIRYRVDGVDFTCPGDSCRMTLPLTEEQGVVIELWAESTLGDNSALQRARVRAYQLAAPEVRYQFDLLGEDWIQLAPSCSLDWDRFPPINPNAHIWLEQPPSYEYLTTANRYALLAGELIWNGDVDASHCPDNGLLANGAASPCGETAAVSLVLTMQNEYDPAIFVAGLEHNIPPKLLKGVFGQESQFWPYSDVPEEYGLARLTDHGIDMLLTWNLPYFLSSCQESLNNESCASGYDSLSDSHKALLRGASYDRIGTPHEVDLIAQTLKASCAQVTQLGENILGEAPGAYFTYQDLWALSLASYHSGPGCVAEAIEAAYDEREGLSWPVVAAYLEGVCQSAIIYVDRVFYLSH